MIKVQIKYGVHEGSIRKTIHEFNVTGHANNEDGSFKDLCASVSTAVTLTANALVFLSLSDIVKVERTSGYFIIKVKEENYVITGLLENLRFTLDSLRDLYPTYVEDFVIEGDSEELELIPEIDNKITPEIALDILGSIPLENPTHPHLSMSKEHINKIQEAYKIIKASLKELNELKIKNLGE